MYLRDKILFGVNGEQKKIQKIECKRFRQEALLSNQSTLNYYNNAEKEEDSQSLQGNAERKESVPRSISKPCMDSELAGKF